MKRSKKLYGLLGVLLVLCMVTFSALKYEEHKELIKNSDEIILEIPSESVKELSWTNESTTLEFVKDEKWVYKSDENFPVDHEKMEELLGVFNEFGVSFIIEDVEDFSQYGLDNPICTINFTTDEAVYEVLLGDYSAMDSQRYVSMNDDNVYLMQNDPLDYFDAVLDDMIDHDDIPFFNQVNSILFSGSENYSIVYEEESTSTYNIDDVYFAEIDHDKLPLDTFRVDAYLQTISNLNPTDYVSYHATSEEIKEFGLDEPELRVTVDYTFEDTDGLKQDDTFVLNVSRDPEEQSKVEMEEQSEEVEAEIITAYARVGESEIVYQISSDQYHSLKAMTYNDLRHLHVITADFSNINKIDATLDEKTYTITSYGEEEDRVYQYMETELDLINLEDAFRALKTDIFTDEPPTQKEELFLKLYLENENYPEITIQLYQYNGTHCLAVVDGKTVGLVERSYVVDIIESINTIVLN